MRSSQTTHPLGKFERRTQLCNYKVQPTRWYESMGGASTRCLIPMMSRREPSLLKGMGQSDKCRVLVLRGRTQTRIEKQRRVHAMTERNLQKWFEELQQHWLLF